MEEVPGTLVAFTVHAYIDNKTDCCTTCHPTSPAGAADKQERSVSSQLNFSFVYLSECCL